MRAWMIAIVATRHCTGDTAAVPSITCDAFAGRRYSIERSLVCAMQGQFPVLARNAAGTLAAVFRTGASHYGLAGTLATAWSSDGGRRWSDPIDVAPRGDDIRNPGFAIAADGRWLLAYWQAGLRCYPGGSWRLPATGDDRADLFAIASSDQGRTWSAPRAQRSELLAWASPYGRMVQVDGTWLLAAYGRPHGGTELARSGLPDRAAPPNGGAESQFDAIVLRSRDGLTWGDESRVLAGASELALCLVSHGHLIGAVRRSETDTAIVHSRDGGRTWSAPDVVTRANEHPADLCVLSGGRLLLTFGRRTRPLGCGALTSSDLGATWDRDRELLLAGDGIGNDVGYPSTVQLDDGTLCTAMYFARGSAASDRSDGWGETSCQLLRYPEALVTG
jgi:sialidase-1